MPLYGLFDARLRGNPVEVHGLRHGTTPLSSRLMIFSVSRVAGEPYGSPAPSEPDLRLSPHPAQAPAKVR